MTHGFIKLCFAPLDFAYAGYYYYSSGSLDAETTFGGFWLRTAVSKYDAYILLFDSSRVNPQSGNYRGVGFPLRCTAK